MVNTNIQGPVPLTGAGFIARRHGNFQPGEFKRLTNVEVDYDGLVGRRPIRHCRGNTPGISAQSINDPFGFIGNMGPWSIITSESHQLAVTAGDTQTMWSPSSLTDPVADFSFHKLIGYFRFNNENWWLTLEYDSSAHIKIKAYHGDIDIDNDVPETYDGTYFSTLTEDTLYTLLASDKDFNKFEFRNFFLQGSRLWLVTSLGIWFSKATDPSEFTPPDGGFFRFPDQTVNYGVSLRDSIYVCCDNAIFTVTYATDPNLDSAVDQISDNAGGEWACVHQDAVYTINQVGIYRIMNNRVDKILENDFDIGRDFYSNSIASFEDYLIVNKFRPYNYEGITDVNSVTRTNLIRNPSFETNLTDWEGDGSYMERAAVTPGITPYMGSDVFRARKVTDLTEITRTNLVENPSFENNTNKWSVPTVPGVDTGGIALDIVGAGTVGSNRLRCLVDTDKFPPPPKGDILWAANGRFIGAQSTLMPVSEGEEYRVLADTQTGSDWSRGRLNLRLMITYYAGTTEVSSEEWGIEDHNLEWKHFDRTITVPTGDSIDNASISFVVLSPDPYNKPITTAPSFRFFVDRVHFELESTYNGYFDGSSTDSTFTIYDWDSTAHESISHQKGGYGSNEEASTCAIHDGLIGVSSSTPYTLGFAGRPTLGSRWFQVIIHQYNSSSTLLSSTNLGATDLCAANAWTYVTKQFTTGSSTAYISFEILTFGPMFNGEFLYLDAFHLETSSTYQGYFDGSETDVGTVLTYSWTGTPHASTSTYLLTAIQRRLYQNGRLFTPGQAQNSLGHNIFFINTVNGSVHVVDFTDCRDGTRGYVVDICVNPNKDSDGNYNAFMLTNRPPVDGFALTLARPYYMNSSRDVEFVDFAARTSGILEAYPPKIDVEIDSFVPDGSEYLVKKFRNVMIMGKFPLTGLDVQFGYDDNGYGSKIDLTSTEISSRPHNPFRIGVNQRGKAMSIRFTNSTSDTPLTEVEPYDSFQLSDLRVLWAYTGHPVGVKNFTG